MKPDSKVFVAGHRGMVGSAIVSQLQVEGYRNILTASRKECDLTNAQQVDDYFARHRPEYVFLAAAKVGGIHANMTYPADFIRDNLQIQTQVIDAAFRNQVRKLVFLGSVCIYPRITAQPIKETELLSGALEPTNEAYAIAKIAGIKMCQMYREQYGFDAISLMPCNLYGPNDNFHPEDSHVLAAFIRRFCQAVEQGVESVTCWGDGSARREFLHVADMARAAIHCAHSYDEAEILNVGTGEAVSILDLAGLIAELVGYRGEILWDHSKPNGAPCRYLDIERISNLGFKPAITLRNGLAQTIEWYQKEHSASTSPSSTR
ncbi:MAG: GDP-L-fucose synthase family protein [Gammaproteobacteria bacterium]